MNVAYATWESILPIMLFERFIVAMIGAGMFAHFMCMASAAPPKSPLIVFIFLGSIVGSAASMFVCAITGQIPQMFALLIAGGASMFLFWLWLWYQGLHVKDFLDKKYG